MDNQRAPSSASLTGVQDSQECAELGNNLVWKGTVGSKSLCDSSESCLEAILSHLVRKKIPELQSSYILLGKKSS